MSTNGNVPASQLRVVDGHGTRLRDWVAAVWFRMVADAARDGVTLKPSHTEPPAPAGLAGYRDYTMQKWLYRHPIGPVAIARPGTSTHGLGNRLDVGSGVAWVAARMGRYGLWREFASEPWHFGFQTSLAGLGLTPITVKARRKSMTTRFVQIGTGGTNFGKGALCALAGDVGYPCPGNFQEYVREGDRDRASYEFEVHGPAIPIEKADWDALKRAYTEGPSVVGGGVSLAEVKAEADRVIAKVPTAADNATAVGKLPHPTYTSTPS